MSTVSEPAPAGKPRRTFDVYEAAPGRWVLTLTYWHPRRSAEDTSYHLSQIPTDLGGLAFKVAHLEVDGGWTYHVRLDGPRSSCDCRGFEAHRHCKHVEALLALQAGGKLPAAPAPAPAYAPSPAPVVPWEDL
jgi:hypothetical protein